MNVSDALKIRKSVRAFTSKSVDKALIEEIFEAARHAPSGVNTQPWKVAVLSGERKHSLEQKLESAFVAGEEKKMDYQYYPLEWKDVYKVRRKECGLQMYSALSITRDDKSRQMQQWAKNYRAFDAPVMLLFYMDSCMQTGSFLDFGMFLQSVMLSATELGLATCPQAALAEYPGIVKIALDLPSESTLICGMSLGYENPEDDVNKYRTSRIEVNEFVTFY